MNEPINRRWLVLAVIWCGALTLTWLNVSLQRDVRGAWEDREREALAILFYDQHEKAMAETVDHRQRYILEAPSLELGKLIIEEAIEGIAEQTRVRHAAIEFRSASTEDKKAQLKLQFSARPTDGLRFIDELRFNHPFLVLQRLQIEPAQQGQDLTCTMDLGCEIRVAGSASEEFQPA